VICVGRCLSPIIVAREKQDKGRFVRAEIFANSGLTFPNRVSLMTFAMSIRLIEVYDRLFSAFGPQQWWPGETPFEIIVGAVLVQNTAWKNVERAIDNLRQAGVLQPIPLYKLPADELQELIRPAGYFRLKAARLRNLLKLLGEEFNGSLDDMFATNLSTLRAQLLEVKGVGPETADSILLYAGGLPTFVVDTYTHRVLARHGWIGYDADYYQIKDHFEASLPSEAALFNEYHALLVRVGHAYCRKTPRCDQCPLRDLLPGGNIVAAD
jgi:endonuclease-3 related protein